MTQGITQYVKHCNICQTNKKPKQKNLVFLLKAMPATDQPFECHNIETVYGFNYSNSTKINLHLITDHATTYVSIQKCYN